VTVPAPEGNCPHCDGIVTHVGTCPIDPIPVCPCGHSESMHTTDGICYAKLDTFPEGGFSGVCPCTPAWLEAQEVAS